MIATGFSLGASAIGFAVGVVAAVIVGLLVLSRRGGVTPLPDTSGSAPELPQWFLWLADAPMFIDERLVSSFYDAILRPDYRTTSLEVSDERTVASSVKTTYGLKASSVIPGLLEATAGGEVSASESQKTGERQTLVPVQNAPRELIRIALHYLNREAPVVGSSSESIDNSRIWQEMKPPEDKSWEAPSLHRILARPRMLAFLDFPSGSKFIPMAIETNSRVVPVYEELVRELQQNGADPCPDYPDDPKDSEIAEKRNRYWKWFDENWSASKALVALEKAAEGGGRPRWVNYRVPVQDGLTLHLNMVGHGTYDVGIFAYNLIKRGARQGVRLVGTVRAEPGLNVLAVYDK